MGARSRILAGCLVCGLCSAPAHGQEDGVFVDPESPTGKEYAIPLEEVRREAGGESAGKVRVGERSAPLFGEGIEPSSSTRSASNRPDDGEGRVGRSSDSRATEAQAGPSGGAKTNGTSAGANDRAPAASASSDHLVVGGIAIGVLALGATGGLLIRRRVTLTR